ncbi:MAG: bifunctional adenosylcobinamide kinase/adenosylcobinamide-phosphate guanylyltransferase, partial [Anaerolineales bacterium]|nr:bifunctional adenosylcobinamide kinase/adenosylcobinamide-phosphate guanylyltransferase [Anaerolineales bacterium]
AEAEDGEMAQRIAKHRAERPTHWQTLETPQWVGAAVAAVDPTAYEVVLLDCLTMLASNVLLALPEAVDAQTAEDALTAEIEALLAVYERTASHWIIVSNEVGLGIVPAYALGRLYRDVLGRANQRLAAAADTVLFMVAGLPMKVK